jgi:hypothetical protein
VVQKILQAKNRFLQFYQHHEVLVSISVFIAGFLFDIFTLGRIDDLLNLIQQAIYLAVLGTLLVIEIKLEAKTIELSEKGKKYWQYHDLLVHFLFGSLLSAYTIFYYTSASAITSFFFILLLAGLMLANEVPQFQRLGLPVRIILYNICVLSYCAFFYPILIGHVGLVPFWLGFISSFFILFLVWKLNFKQDKSKELLRKHVLIPTVAIHLVFLLGYYTSLIPPVPIAVKRIGIYYEVTKEDGKYIGKHQRAFWKIWEKGSQSFMARKGDTVVVLLSIFSPARFEDQVYLKWYFDEPQGGWHLEDTIPLSILGGRDEGFRGYGVKQYYRFGNWRIIVETSDGREVGRIHLEIQEDTSTNDRIFKTDTF